MVVDAGERRDGERQPMDPDFFGVTRMAGTRCGEGCTAPCIYECTLNRL